MWLTCNRHGTFHGGTVLYCHRLRAQPERVQVARSIAGTAIAPQKTAGFAGRGALCFVAPRMERPRLLQRALKASVASNSRLELSTRQMKVSFEGRTVLYDL